MCYDLNPGVSTDHTLMEMYLANDALLPLPRLVREFIVRRSMGLT
jgi:hypothetical protein